MSFPSGFLLILSSAMTADSLSLSSPANAYRAGGAVSEWRYHGNRGANYDRTTLFCSDCSHSSGLRRLGRVRI
ncbi:hypothetical protein DFH07DRAFT_809410 [Mycena maculata]|uniref:Secreted protein n=1 Tax=Mycena maculata TaxID=230809 RepID=A0AAD7NMD2_9AGAR|nr:hypothetical protein DFH07DRAFT_809410 [Mycena maculata]